MTNPYAPWDYSQYGTQPSPEDEQQRRLQEAAKKLGESFSGRKDIYAQNDTDIPPEPNELRDTVAGKLQGGGPAQMDDVETPAPTLTPAAPTPVATPVATPTPAASTAMTSEEFAKWKKSNADKEAVGLAPLPMPEGKTAPVETPKPAAVPPPEEYDTSKQFWKTGEVYRAPKDTGFTYKDTKGKVQTVLGKDLASAGLSVPKTKDNAEWKKLMLAYGKKFNKYPKVPQASTGAAPTEKPLTAPAASVAPSGTPGIKIATEGQAGVRKVEESTKPNVNPEQAKRAQGVLDESKDLRNEYLMQLRSAMNLSPGDEEKMNASKKKALDDYTNAMSGEQKAVFWDKMIRGLGKITAGTVGLHGLGVGGKQIVQPGLDIAKHYATGETYDPSLGKEAAKTRLVQDLKTAETPLQRQKAKLEMLEKLKKAGATDQEIAAYLKLLEMTKGTEKTTTTEEQSVENKPMTDPLAVAKASTPKSDIKTGGTTDVDLFVKTNRERVGAANRAVPVNIKNEADALNHLKQTYPEAITEAGLGRMLKEELVTSNGDYTTATTNVKQKLSKLFSVPENVNSPEYSLWYFDTYQPMKGQYEVTVGLPADRYTINTVGGKPTKSLDYFPDSNTESAYAKIYSKQTGDDQQKHEKTMQILRGMAGGQSTSAAAPAAPEPSVVPRKTPNADTRMQQIPNLLKRPK